MDAATAPGLIPAITALLTSLIGTGPVGAVIASVIVGLALAVIVFARMKDLWSGSKGDSQGLAFQDKLLKLVDTLQASEVALRARIDAMDRESGAQRDEIEALRADLALVRNQRRRLIEMLRAMKSEHPVVHPSVAGVA